MIAYKLDNKGDRILVDGVFQTVSGKGCVAQRLNNAIKWHENTWFLNTEKGFPWLDFLQSKNNNFKILNSYITEILNSDPEVLRVNFVNSIYNNGERKLQIDFSVSTVYGKIEREIGI